MVIIKTGPHITDIKGGVGGVVFSRDKSGIHARSKPRRVKRRTTGQRVQQNAFSKARSFSKVNRTVSYNIYRILNGLSTKEPPTDYTIPKL